MKRIILTALVIISFIASAVMLLTLNTSANATPEQVATLERANQLYDNNNFTAAQTLYEQLLAEGVENAEVYFNLGNTLMQQRQFADAITAYENARDFSPRDEDIANNLAFAYQQAGLSQPDDVVSVVLSTFSVNELATIALVIWTVLIALVLLLRDIAPKTIYQPAFALFMILFILSGAVLFGRMTMNDTVIEQAPIVAGAELPDSVSMLGNQP